MAKRVLITGGAGFLGVSIARQLVKRGYTIRIFDRINLSAEDLANKVEVMQGDIRNKNDVEKAVKGQDYIIHAAALLPPQKSKKLMFEINVGGTENILNASLKNKIKRLVFISSTEVYGVPKNCPLREESFLDPIGDYGKSKIAGERLCRNYMQKGLSINILRSKTFLGPGKLGVFQKLFEAIRVGKSVFILGNGKNLFQLLAVSDLVDVVEKSMIDKIDNQIFNIGASSFGTWKGDLEEVIKYQKSRSKIIGLPMFLIRIILPILKLLRFNLEDISHYESLVVPSFVSIEKAEKLLKWHPKKSNNELLLESYKWYTSSIINR